LQIGSDNNNNDGGQALLAMAEYDWITYLGSNRMPLAIKYALLANPYILQIFGNEESIAIYRRDDSTIQSLPAISIYEDVQDTQSRFYSDKGQIRFDIFLPIRLAREDNAVVIKTIGQAFKNILQSPHFWGNLNDKLVPLPEPISSIYNDVVRYKELYGSPLVEFAKNCKITSPLKPSLTDIGDAWRLDLVTDYYYDMSNHYAMLEDFGIEGKVDPNKIIYQILKDFSVDVQPISSL
jgi:hypothetical protein